MYLYWNREIHEPMQIDPFRILEQRRMKREEERAKLNARMAELTAEGHQDAIVKAWLEKEYPNGFQSDTPVAKRMTPILGDVVAAQEGVVATNHKSVDHPPIKDMLLAIVKEAYPNGLKASQIRAKAYVRWGVEINQNTLTVSLARHQEHDRVKCVNRLWFYVQPTDWREVLRPSAPQLELKTNGHANGGLEKSESPDASPGS